MLLVLNFCIRLVVDFKPKMFKQHNRKKKFYFICQIEHFNFPIKFNFIFIFVLHNQPIQFLNVFCVIGTKLNFVIVVGSI